MDAQSSGNCQLSGGENMQKNFVLDTNVLVHSDGLALHRFEENNLWIPTVVLEELDNLKERRDKPETAYAARSAIRILKEFSKQGNLLEGVPTQDGGKLYLLVDETVAMDLPTGWDPKKPDNMILMMTRSLSKRPSVDNVVLVTNDGNVQLKAVTLGIPVEEYRSDRVDLTRLYTGRTVRHASNDVFAEFVASCNREWTNEEKAARSMILESRKDENQLIDDDQAILAMKESEDLEDVNKAFAKRVKNKTKDTFRKKPSPVLPERPPRSITVAADSFHEGTEDLVENEYVQLATWEGNGTFLTQYKNGHLTELVHQDDPIFDLTMLNEGQRFFKEALMKSAEEAPLVCGMGPAGTGKTLLAFAAGLEQAYNQHLYDQVLLCRANIMAGGKDEDIGFLPGTEQEKISPLFRGAEDAIRLLFPYQKPDAILAELMDRGVLNMQAVAYLRGRSIANSFIILDEAQNMTPNLMLMLLSRLGEGSKIVCLGDPNQVDNPHLSMRNNGLVYTIDRMKGSSLCEVITFEETECKRSPLSKEVSQRMKL